MKTGLELITEERMRQIEKEGWTPEHDSQHVDEELARAAATYALPAEYREFTIGGRVVTWPFEAGWFKPTPEDRIRELAKAGALIAAEIDRLQA